MKQFAAAILSAGLLAACPNTPGAPPSASSMLAPASRSTLEPNGESRIRLLSEIGELAREHRDTGHRNFFELVLERQKTLSLNALENAAACTDAIEVIEGQWVNFLDLERSSPQKRPSGAANRIEELYIEWTGRLEDPDALLPWLLDQTYATDGPPVRLFPDRGDPGLIYRGMKALIPLVRAFASRLDARAAGRVHAYAEAVLTPPFSETLSESLKQTLVLANRIYHRLDESLAERAALAGDSPALFEELSSRIEQLNERARFENIPKGDRAHLVQRIEQINRMTGDHPALRARHPRIPGLKKEENTVYLKTAALGILGDLGLSDETVLKRVLSFSNKFENAEIRKAAISALQSNAQDVEPFLVRGIVSSAGMEEKKLIARKYDQVIGGMKPVQLGRLFGRPGGFRKEFESLASILNVERISLVDFLNSPYANLPRIQAEFPSRADDETRVRRGYFRYLNDRLAAFKRFVLEIEDGGFDRLIDRWGVQFVLGWSLSDYGENRPLFGHILEDTKRAVPGTSPLEAVLQGILERENAHEQIERFMITLLHSRISFDYDFFRSLFRAVAQRNRQIEGGARVVNVFSEERMRYHVPQAEVRDVALENPVVFEPVVKFLIVALNLKRIQIPTDAFVETDISFYLNSLARLRNPELSYRLFLAHRLIASIPHTRFFEQEQTIRNLVSRLDESYHRVADGYNELFRFLRIKNHRDPSSEDLDLAEVVLNALSDDTRIPGEPGGEIPAPLSRILAAIERTGGLALNAHRDVREYFLGETASFRELGRALRWIRGRFAETNTWKDIARALNARRDREFLQRDAAEQEGAPSASDLDRAVLLIRYYGMLLERWSDEFSLSSFERILSPSEKMLLETGTPNEKIALVRAKRRELRNVFERFDPALAPREYLELKRHLAEDIWGYSAFGIWPRYQETKFEAYQQDRKAALLERRLLDARLREIEESMRPGKGEAASRDPGRILNEYLDLLVGFMEHLAAEGLAPSRTFRHYRDILEHDRALLTASMLKDLVGLIRNYTVNNIDNFFAFAFGDMPSQIARAVGRERLDPEFRRGPANGFDDASFYDFVQEKVLGDLRGTLEILPRLERCLDALETQLAELDRAETGQPLFPKAVSPAGRRSPVERGLKGFNQEEDERAGFRVPPLEILETRLFRERPELLEVPALKRHLVDRILLLEKSTGKAFPFRLEKMEPEAARLVARRRRETGIDPENAPRLALAARSGSFRSMPGILGTVINIGFPDPLSLEDGAFQDDADRYHRFDSRRHLLSTFGTVVYGIEERVFSDVIDRVKSEYAARTGRQNVSFSAMGPREWRQTVREFRRILERADRERPAPKRLRPDYGDPLDLLAHAVIGVWRSWDSPEAIQMRRMLGVSGDWRTPVILQEMRSANLNPRSWSAIVISGNTNERDSVPRGDLLFNSAGVNIASGLASRGVSLDELKDLHPGLHRRIIDLVRDVKQSTGNLEVDVELTGEWDPGENDWNIYLLQRRGIHSTLNVAGKDRVPVIVEAGTPSARGKAVVGGTRHAVLVNGVNVSLKDLARDLEQLRGRMDAAGLRDTAILLLMEYVDPGEALKFNLPEVDGMLTTKIGTSSHASIIARRLGKLLLSEVEGIRRQGERWFFENGDEIHPSRDLFTVVGLPLEKSPLSGNIYKGALPLRSPGEPDRETLAIIHRIPEAAHPEYLPDAPSTDIGASA
jgi:hypothetical protein